MTLELHIMMVEVVFLLCGVLTLYEVFCLSRQAHTDLMLMYEIVKYICKLCEEDKERRGNSERAVDSEADA